MEQALCRELERFGERLAESGANADTIYDRKGHLRAAVGASGAGSATWLIAHPATGARAVRQHGQRGSRQGRLRALISFAQCSLPQAAAMDFVSAIERELPRRLRPRDGFLNIDVGGSSKLVRRRVPLLYDDGQRLVDAAAAIARRDCALRDAAWAAMHVWSTLRPMDILALDWDQVLALLEDAAQEAIGRVVFSVNGRSVPSVVMPGAREALRAYWDSRGRPRVGAIFVSVRQPRSRLSSEYAAQLLKEAAHEAGFARLDRRLMRAPLVSYLRRVKGWGRLELRDACGLLAVKEINCILRLVDELTAQIQAAEATFIPEPASSPSQGRGEGKLRPTSVGRAFSGPQR